MGTPEFAVPSLSTLIEKGFTIAGVITSPDKPAGRGQKKLESPVKRFALQHNLKILQPEKLKNPDFVAELEALKPDLQVVVAFRMLPEIVWNMPAKGTINLHASLLPQYRGAAPINWAIINGETKSGLTTFFIEKEIDTGNILFQKEVTVSSNYNAGDLHNILMDEGAKLVLKTVETIKEGDFKETNQSQLINKDEELKSAPKIFKEDCYINWEQPVDKVYNLIRGLSPYPTAWCEIEKDDTIILLKIFKTEKNEENHSYEPGTIQTDGKNYCNVAVKNGFINIHTLQQAGKKRMDVKDFLRGFKDIGEYKMVIKKIE